MEEIEVRRSYEGALVAAGATVLAFEEFGSYQGDWLAKVEFEGATFWLRDYFGSCSGCDEIEAELSDLGWDADKSAVHKRLAEIGARHLEDQERLSYEEALAKAGEHISWDSSADDMIAFVKANA